MPPLWKLPFYSVGVFRAMSVGFKVESVAPVVLASAWLFKESTASPHLTLSVGSWKLQLSAKGLKMKPAVSQAK